MNWEYICEAQNLIRSAVLAIICEIWRQKVYYTSLGIVGNYSSVSVDFGVDGHFGDSVTLVPHLTTCPDS